MSLREIASQLDIIEVAIQIHSNYQANETGSTIGKDDGIGIEFQAR